MSEMRSICVINFSGRTSDWEGWSEKFLARSKKKGYKKFLTGKDDIPTAEEYEKAVADVRESGDNIIKFNGLNEETFEDIVLSISHAKRQNKIAFSLIENCKSAEYSAGNCKLSWDPLVAKYLPKTAPWLLKSKNFLRTANWRVWRRIPMSG